MGIVVFWFVMAGVVAIIANSKGYDSGSWFLYGLLIWPIALVHILTKPTDTRIAERQAVQSAGMKKCLDCAELVKAEARKCRYCGHVFPVPAQTAPTLKPTGQKMRSLDRYK